MDVGQPTTKGIVLAEDQADYIVQGATIHLSYKYLRGVKEGEEIILCSKKTMCDLAVIKIHALLSFRGNRFIPNIEAMSSCHGISAGEFAYMRLLWPAKSQERDGAVGWQFHLIEAMNLWVPNDDSKARSVAQDRPAPIEQNKLMVTVS